ncbi:MAG: single-stranded-DNA-specific exonuclease RecJ [Flavobacteriaceae bacterium]|nr:single-stranded-DNA-specific exonuclease RecJ [Flavobacteriaceae bacterium]|tara:strand:- start:7633 stop:9318 length:1686 start_codon:yes stop_codon:yes gene_type:complete
MRWKFRPEPEKEKVNQLANALQIDKKLATLLCQRNIETFEEAKKFFRPNLKDLHDPFLMKDMDVAVHRIEKALQNEEQILIYGDYDVDGTTAVSLLYSYLRTLTSNISTYIPDRYDEGYGVSLQGIDFAEDNGFSLIIALDCGIKAIEQVAYAKEKHIDFIICDHHKPGDEIPDAIAILNPKRSDCTYPFKELCGCGVGFKLIQALASKQGETIESLTSYLDLVATAIAADIVPIVGENRILSYFGIQVINKSPRTGIKALLLQTKKRVLTITDVVFTIAPRINAAGRIKHGNAAVELLIENDLDKAISYAEEIESYNKNRRELDAKITEEALEQIKSKKEENNCTTVVYKDIWHKGVIGIVASRLTETYYRPTLVFTKSGDKLAASARSVKGFDVYNALHACEDLLIQFGGHKYAAGLTMKSENYEKFKERFEKVVSETIDKKLLEPEILVDTELEFSEISPKFFKILKQLAPFGPQNMKPVFKSSNVRDNGYGKRVGSDKKHLKLSLFQGENTQTINAIGFGLGEKEPLIKNDFDVVYSLDENEWNGYKSLQLVLKDIQ